MCSRSSSSRARDTERLFQSALGTHFSFVFLSAIGNTIKKIHNH